MKLFLDILGAVLVLAGLGLFWLPIPLGLPLIGVGMALLIANSRTVRGWIRTLRENNQMVDKVLREAEDVLPDRIAEPLEETDDRPPEKKHHKKD